MDFATSSSLAQFRDQRHRHRHHRRHEGALRTFPYPWTVSVLSACSGPYYGFGYAACLCLGHGPGYGSDDGPGLGPCRGGLDLAPGHDPYPYPDLFPFPCRGPDSCVGLCLDFCCDFYNSKVFHKLNFI